MVANPKISALYERKADPDSQKSSVHMQVSEESDFEGGFSKSSREMYVSGTSPEFVDQAEKDYLEALTDEEKEAISKQKEATQKT